VIPSYFSYSFGCRAVKIGNERAREWENVVSRAENAIIAGSPEISFENLHGPLLENE